MKFSRRLGLLAGVTLLISGISVPLLGVGVAQAAGDPQGTIYVADEGANAVDVFAPGSNGNVAPERVIEGSSTGLDGPGDVKVDSAGDLYVVNFSGNTITEYAPGASGNATPTCTIGGSNTGLSTPDDMSLEADGTIVVGNLFASTVGIFAPGSCGNVAPIETLAGSNTGFNDVDGVGTDAAGNIYANSTLNESINVFPAGANGNVAPSYTITGSNTGLGWPDDIVVGFSGELYAVSGFTGPVNSVTVYSAGAMGNAVPLQNIVGSNTDFGNPDDNAVDTSGNIFVTDSESTVGPAVLEFASGATGNVAPIATIAGSATNLSEPEGVDIAGPPPPTFTTAASATTIGLGSMASDTATISGNSPTGSIVFKAFGPSDPTCSLAPAFVSSPVTVSGNGSYPSPSFTPGSAGTYSWEALYSGDMNNAPAQTACGDPAETFTVLAPTITLSGTDVSSTEGAGFSGQVASFTDTNSSSTASEYSASIDWGDANPPSAGTVSGPTGGPYTVNGTHTYTEEGSYTITTSVTDSLNPANDKSTTSTATVGDAAINATCATSVSTEAFSGTVAGLTDANPFATTADYTVSIDWGDASPPSAGTVSGPTGGPFAVNGTHTYASTGAYTVSATVTDDGGSTSTASGCSLIIYAFAPGGGSFVIGDNDSATGTNVTFWGSQWWKHNSLSGGPAPAAFKGYALNPTTPSCGATWSTDPGNSTPPPAGPLPSYMGVIVTSSARKSGSQISGDTPNIVVVKTNPGYEPNPGHRGTGTVVAQVC